MSGPMLHLRARQVPLAAATAASAAGLVWGIWAAFTDQPRMSSSFAAIVVALAVVPAFITLTGADEALERTGSRFRPLNRGIHLVGALAAAVALLAAAAATGSAVGAVPLLLRDAAGLLGLTALGATVFGGPRAWFLAVGWAALAVPFSDPGARPVTQALTWVVQPPDSGVAATVAAALAAVGAGAYAFRGARLPASTDVHQA